MTMAYREARTPASKGKKLDYIRLKRGEDGGHEVEHYFQDDGMNFHKPKAYVFGKDEADDLQDHLRKHMGVGVKVEGGDGDDAA